MTPDKAMPEKMASSKRETIKTPEGNEVSYAPGRGGLITSIKFGGTEILYLDEATFRNRNVSVKGGVPVLFPNAGGVTNQEKDKLKQLYPELALLHEKGKHGFARDMNWRASKWRNGFEQTLTGNEATKVFYPYDFRLAVSGQFIEDGSFTIIQKVENFENEKDMPVSMGLHPYFKVPFGNKKGIRFEFEGGQIIEESISTWANEDHAVSIENPKVKDPNAVMKIIIPDFGTLILDASSEYKRIWVWSLKEKDFVCVEPVMRDSGGLADNPEMIPAAGMIEASLNIKFDKLKEPHARHKRLNRFSS